MTQDEAEYLRERILIHASGTALAFLVSRGRLVEENTPFPWDHPQAEDMPKRIQEQLTHARNFSVAIHGAALLYNEMLAELSGAEEKIEDFEARLEAWLDGLRARADELLGWDRNRFWRTVLTADPRIPIPTRSFVDTWLDTVQATLRHNRGVGHFLDDGAPARALIKRREHDLKKSQARLENPNALQLWNGEAGTRPLSYRWPVVRDIVKDILHGLAGEGERLHA